MGGQDSPHADYAASKTRVGGFGSGHGKTSARYCRWQARQTRALRPGSSAHAATAGATVVTLNSGGTKWGKQNLRQPSFAKASEGDQSSRSEDWSEREDSN